MTDILSIHRPEQKLVKGFYLDNSESGKWNFHLENCFPERAPCYGNLVGSCSHLCYRCPWWDKHCLPESQGLHRSGGTCLKTWIMSMHYSGWSTRRLSRGDWTTCAMACQLDRIYIKTGKFHFSSSLTWVSTSSRVIDEDLTMKSLNIIIVTPYLFIQLFLPLAFLLIGSRSSRTIVLILAHSWG